MPRVRSRLAPSSSISASIINLTTGQFFGDTNRTIRLEGLTLTDTVYTHRFVDWHYHENAYFTFILQGGVLEGNRSGVYECPAGSLLYHNWQDPHYNRKNEDFTRGMQIELDKGWIETMLGDAAADGGAGGAGMTGRAGGAGMTGRAGATGGTGGAANGNGCCLPAGSLRLEHPAAKLLFYRIFRESLEPLADAELAIQSLLLEVFATGFGVIGARRSAIPPYWVSRLRELLHAEFREPRSLTEIASELDLHPVHLSRDFRKYFGSTMGEYIRQLRVGSSLSLLSDRGRSLTDIAYDCGFADQSHFIRCFKDSQGCSPTVYRRMLRGAC